MFLDKILKRLVKTKEPKLVEIMMEYPTEIKGIPEPMISTITCPTYVKKDKGKV